MNWDSFFLYLQRINLVIFLLASFAIIGVIVYESRSGWQDVHELSHVGYADESSPAISEYEGEEIKIADGAVIKYQLSRQDDPSLDIAGENISLTNMQTGKSTTVLPADTDQLVLRWEVVGAFGEDSTEPTAFLVLAGTEQDYRDGYLDIIIGDLRDLRQKTLIKRIRFVDGARMVDPETMSLIVWTSDTEARFWMVDMATLEVTLDRPVQVPPKRES